MPTIVLKLRGRELSRHPVVRRVTRIGRDVGSDVRIDNEGVSRLHASIRYRGGSFHAVDEGSVNGIFVNGEPTDLQRLGDGDELQIGKFTLVFLDAGGVQPAELLDDHLPAAPVNPVQTTAIDTRDLQRMVRERRQAAGQHHTVDLTPPPIARQPPRADFARTWTGPPGEFDSRARATATRGPSGAARGQVDHDTTRLLVIAVGFMGVALLALSGVVIYLLLTRG